MIHLKSLPGTPRNCLSIDRLIDSACRDASIYVKHNFDAVIVENMCDVPYVTCDKSGPETVAVMTRICAEVKRILNDIPCGVQILAAMNKEAMATALAAGLQFTRCESFVFSHIADEGLMNACAGELMRYRKLIGAQDVLVFTDIKKKHCSHAITGDIDIKNTAEAAKFFLSDGAIVTGTRTGDSPTIVDVEEVKKVGDFPVLIGSGVNIDNLEIFLKLKVDALIVGSYFKENGFWENEIDEERVRRFVGKYNSVLR